MTKRNDDGPLANAGEHAFSMNPPSAGSPPLEANPPSADKLTETDSPTTDAGQVHPAVGNPAPVTQEGRDIRDGSQHVQALLSRLGAAGGGALSEIQMQKLESHPGVKALLAETASLDGTAFLKAMRLAQSDSEREAIIRAATAADPGAAVLLLREPEDPNADPVRDRPAPSYRVDDSALAGAGKKAK